MTENEEILSRWTVTKPHIILIWTSKYTELMWQSGKSGTLKRSSMNYCWNFVIEISRITKILNNFFMFWTTLHQWFIDTSNLSYTSTCCSRKKRILCERHMCCVRLHIAIMRYPIQIDSIENEENCLSSLHILVVMQKSAFSHRFTCFFHFRVLEL